MICVVCGRASPSALRRRLAARFVLRWAGFAFAVFFCLRLCIGPLIVLFARRCFGVGRRVSGKILPLLWHQALHLARHELPKVNP